MMKDTGKIMEIGNLVDGVGWSSPQRGRVYLTKGISPAIYTFAGGGLVVKIIESDERRNNIQGEVHSGVVWALLRDEQ